LSYKCACEEAFDIEISDEDWEKLHAVEDVDVYVASRARKIQSRSSESRSMPSAPAPAAIYRAHYKYSKEYMWLETNGGTGTVGITYCAQESLGEIVFVVLPKIGSHVNAEKLSVPWSP